MSRRCTDSVFLTLEFRNINQIPLPIEILEGLDDIIYISKTEKCTRHIKEIYFSICGSENNRDVHVYVQFKDKFSFLVKETFSFKEREFKVILWREPELKYRGIKNRKENKLDYMERAAMTWHDEKMFFKLPSCCYFLLFIFKKCYSVQSP